jgi:hypothetical protein
MDYLDAATLLARHVVEKILGCCWEGRPNHSLKVRYACIMAAGEKRWRRFALISFARLRKKSHWFICRLEFALRLVGVWVKSEQRLG